MTFGPETIALFIGMTAAAFSQLATIGNPMTRVKNMVLGWTLFAAAVAYDYLAGGQGVWKAGLATLFAIALLTVGAVRYPPLSRASRLRRAAVAAISVMTTVWLLAQVGR